MIKMKFCGRQARWQKLIPPRHKATDPYRRALGLISSHQLQNITSLKFMRKQLSSIEFLNHFIYGIAGLIPMLVMMGFIGYFALSWIKEDLAIFIITFLFFLIAAFLAISMIRIYFNLVDFIITDQTFIIERFGKSAELPFSIIKETET